MKQLSIEELRDVVENEGLGYAIQYAVDSGDIADPEIQEKWEQAKGLLEEIEEALDE